MSKAHRGTGVRTEPNHGRGNAHAVDLKTSKFFTKKKLMETL